MAQINVKINPAFVDSTIMVDDAVFQKPEYYYQVRYDFLVSWFLDNYPELLPVLQDQLDNHHVIFSLQDGPGKTLQPFIPNEFIPHTVWYFKWIVAAEMQKALLWLEKNANTKAKISQGNSFVRALNNLMAAKLPGVKQTFITGVLARPQNDDTKRDVFYAMYGAQLQPEPGFQKWKGDYTARTMNLYDLLYQHYSVLSNKYKPKQVTGRTGGKLQFEVPQTEAQINASGKLNRPQNNADSNKDINGLVGGLIDRISTNKWTPIIALGILLVLLFAARKVFLQ